MRLLKRLRQRIKFAFHYKIVIASVDKTIIVEHRFLHDPKIETITTEPNKLRGAQINAVYFDEYANYDA